MSWSIRSRLTIWYSAVVVLVLVTSTLVIDATHRRVLLRHLDEEMARQMLTLLGVMRTEFNEGLSLQESADEASIEVIAPDRTLILTRPDGDTLARWGAPIEATWQPAATTALVETHVIGGRGMRILSQRAQHGELSYLATVLAPLSSLDQAVGDLRQTLALGIVVALTLAAVGGLIVGRQTLRPLDEMARQAAAITEATASARLHTPHPDDELGRLASSFNSLLDRLVNALQMQKQFMADASHELRSPVSVVRATAQVTLSREDRSPDDYREMMQVVDEQGERLAHLVDAMFLLSRAESNGLPLVPEAVYIDEIVSDSVRALQVLARDRQVTVSASGDEDVAFMGDNRLLRQMVTNLVDNAIHHATVGGVVSARVSLLASGIELRVTDNGAGVEDEDRERIFHRFARRSQDYTGAGLGLPIARWIAEAHGGSLVLDPTSRAGNTTFTVRLPQGRER